MIADASLNAAFLGVALRVASTKLVAVLEVEPATAGIAWSGGRTNSGVGSSVADAADAASSAFLSACTVALATSLGPIAKVFVRDAVRQVCSGRLFTRSEGPALLAHLAGMIDDAHDRAAFQSATRRL